jgi:5-methylcytosine-specific restriction endonuclease McrA
MASRKDEKGKAVYGYKWVQAKNGYLAKYPDCKFCSRPATVVDHIKPHKGDLKVFWNKANWQALCKLCHDQVKQRDEQSNVSRGVNTDGTPLNNNSEWYK